MKKRAFAKKSFGDVGTNKERESADRLESDAYKEMLAYDEAFRIESNIPPEAVQKVSATLESHARLFRNLAREMPKVEIDALVRVFCLAALIDAEKPGKPTRFAVARGKAQKKRLSNLPRRIAGVQEDLWELLGGRAAPNSLEPELVSTLVWLENSADVARASAANKDSAGDERKKVLDLALDETLCQLAQFSRTKLAKNRVPYEGLADLLDLTARTLNIQRHRDYTGAFLRSRVYRHPKRFKRAPQIRPA